MPLARENLVKKILIIRTSSLGDVFHTFPALNALKTKAPNIVIHWLIKERFSTLLQPIRFIDKIHVISSSKGLYGRLQLIKQLEKEHFDVVVDFQGLLRTGIWAYLTGCNRRIGFSIKEARHKTNCLFTNIRVTPSKQDQHVVQKNMCLLRPLGITELSDIPISYHLTQETYSKRNLTFQKHKIDLNTCVVGIHIGASWRHATKCWPISYYNDLIKRLPNHINIIIMAGPDEESKLNIIQKKENVIFVPKLSLLEMATFLQSCHLVIGSDSGPIHMAASLGIKTLCLMGPTSPTRLRPWGPNQHYIHKGLNCSHCLKNICFRKNRCMKSIHVNEVLRIVNRILFSNR